MRGTHHYQVIYAQLRKEIAEGRYTVGMRLPTEKELCKQFSVSRATAKHVMDILVNEGFVTRTKGKGTFLVARTPMEHKNPSWQGSKLIGVILPDFSDVFGGRLLHGIEAECTDKGVHLLLRLSKGSYELERRALCEMEVLGIQGFIIAPLMREMYNPKLLELLLKRFPVVILDRRMPGLDASFVGTDNETSVQRIMEHLFSLGHEQIAWISPPIVPTTPLELRQNAFLHAHMQRGQVPNRQLWYNKVLSTTPGQGTSRQIQADIEGITGLLQAHSEITAVFTSEYNVAWMVAHAASRIGLCVPEDLSIACFDLPGSYALQQEFTHIQQDEEGIGNAAVRMLIQHMERPDAPHEDVRFAGAFYIGRSTAPVRRQKTIDRAT